MMDPALKELLQQTIIVEAFVSEDVYRQRTYDEASPRSLDARVRAKRRRVRMPNGEEVVSNSEIVLDGDPGIGERDRVTLPDGKQPEILQIDRVPDETGTIHHTRLTLGYNRSI